MQPGVSERCCMHDGWPVVKIIAISWPFFFTWIRGYAGTVYRSAARKNCANRLAGICFA